MANVESSNWVMNAAERERAQKIEDMNAKKLAEGGKPNIQPKKLIKSGLRALSVGRIILAAMTPGVGLAVRGNLYPADWPCVEHYTLLGHFCSFCSSADVGDGLDGHSPSTEVTSPDYTSYGA